MEQIALLRDVLQRAAYRGMIAGFDPECFILIDKSHFVQSSAHRCRGRGKRGRAAPVQLTLMARGRRFSLLGAFNCQGFAVNAGEVVRERGVDVDTFVEWVEDMLWPVLQPYVLGAPYPNSVVILDNASVHWDPRVPEAIATTGALLRFMPPYSPDMSPIEASFNNLKKHLKRNEVVARV